MAKKNKQQKIRAENRRLHQMLGVHYTFSAPKKSPDAINKNPTTTFSASYVYRDLTKTSLMVSIILAIEFMIYLIAEKNGWMFVEKIIK